MEEEKLEVLKKSPLVWAYIGDAVYELAIRKRIVSKTNTKAHNLHIKIIKLVNAKKQADVLNKLQEKEFLSEEELDVARRARNTKNYHIPKNTSPIQYAMSTALEAVIGYNYLLGNHDRNNEIFEEVYNILGI